jgi:hypothetical protein
LFVCSLCKVEGFGPASEHETKDITKRVVDTIPFFIRVHFKFKLKLESKELENFKNRPVSQRYCPFGCEMIRQGAGECHPGLEWTIFEINWTVLKIGLSAKLYFYVGEHVHLH